MIRDFEIPYRLIVQKKEGRREERYMFRDFENPYRLIVQGEGRSEGRKIPKRSLNS